MIPSSTDVIPPPSSVLQIPNSDISKSDIVPNTSSRPVRNRKLPSKYSEYTGLPSHISSTNTSTARNVTEYPLALHYQNFTPSYKAFLANVDQTYEPKTFHQAIKYVVELAALEAKNTWQLVPLTHDKQIVGCKWLYKIKFNADGTVERYKARLVAKGFTQTEGLDYFETFAPVAKMITARVLLAIAAASAWPVTQMDVTNAFLHGDLEEEVYMEIPPGFNIPSHLQSVPNLVCKLVKSLYGLKQAPRKWFLNFCTVLIHYGFTQAHTDHSLFVLHKDQSTMLMIF